MLATISKLVPVVPSWRIGTPATVDSLSVACETIVAETMPEPSFFDTTNRLRTLTPPASTFTPWAGVYVCSVAESKPQPASARASPSAVMRLSKLLIVLSSSGAHPRDGE